MSYYDWYYTKPKKKAKPAKPDPSHKPVAIEGKKIAHTFWGKAWCDNLERYGDYENRLPRGRTYVRQGTVLHLDIAPGKVEALVQGSSLYKVKVEVDPVSEAKWKAMRKSCAGSIASQVELLQGQVPEVILKRICDLQEGLFPTNKELRFSCSCPDWAVMCKHVAAACYGIGARLDHSPELFFTLRQVDMNELLADNMAAAAEAPVARGAKVLAGDGLEALFGLDMGGDEVPKPIAPVRTAETRKIAVKKSKRTAVKKKTVKKVSLKKPTDKPVPKAVKKAAAASIAKKKPAAKRTSTAGALRNASGKAMGKAVKKAAVPSIEKKLVVKKPSSARSKVISAGKPVRKGVKQPVARAVAGKRKSTGNKGTALANAVKKAKPKKSVIANTSRGLKSKKAH